jgi:NADPH-dependent F420 reductase
VPRSIGFIGGTGPEGKGLAARFASAGLEVFVGSRSPERGAEAAREVADLAGGNLRGGSNAEAADAEVVVVTVPYAGLQETLTPLAQSIGDRIVVSTVVPLSFSRARVALRPVPAGSAAQEVQEALPAARVTGAFHNLSASHLIDLSHRLEGDVVVCGDDPGAREEVIALAELLEGIRGLNGGPLANCQLVEASTALLLNLNRIYKAETHLKVLGI